MARNTNLIHYLLILCIGFMPTFSLGLDDVNQMGHGSTSCLDCDPMEMALDLTCESDICLPTAHACGANHCAGFIPVNAVTFDDQVYRLISERPGEPVFRSHLTETIYRPPIF